MTPFTQWFFIYCFSLRDSENDPYQPHLPRSHRRQPVCSWYGNFSDQLSLNFPLTQLSYGFLLGPLQFQDQMYFSVWVSIKRGVLVGVGVGLGVGASFLYIFLFMFFFLFFNPNSDFSQFVLAVYPCNIFGYKENRVTFQSRQSNSISCQNFFSSSSLISAIEIHKKVELVEN